MKSFEKAFNSMANWFYGFRQRPISLPPTFKGIVAHRGVHGQGLAQENSEASFQLALENKIWGIEFDVRWTKDNVPIIYHDPHLGRLHQRPDVFIADLNFSELKGLAPDIPSLEEVVRKFGKNLHFMIELKEEISNSSQQEKLKQVLSPLVPIDDFHFMALKTENLKSLTGYPKEALLNIAWLNMSAAFQETLEDNLGGLTGHFVLLREEYRKALREKGMTYGTGFIETEGTLYKEIQRGSAWVFTNVPLRLKAFLN